MPLNHPLRTDSNESTIQRPSTRLEKFLKSPVFKINIAMIPFFIVCSYIAAEVAPWGPDQSTTYALSQLSREANITHLTTASNALSSCLDFFASHGESSIARFFPDSQSPTQKIYNAIRYIFLFSVPFTMAHALRKRNERNLAFAVLIITGLAFSHFILGKTRNDSGETTGEYELVYAGVFQKLYLRSPSSSPNGEGGDKDGE